MSKDNDKNNYVDASLWMSEVSIITTTDKNQPTNKQTKSLDLGTNLFI